MRKPKDFDSEIKALDERARLLKARKIQQLGELVMATGADALGIEMLAGALLAASGAEPGAKGVWHAAGTTFFQASRRKHSKSADSDARSAPQDSGGALPLVGGALSN